MYGNCSNGNCYGGMPSPRSIYVPSQARFISDIARTANLDFETLFRDVGYSPLERISYRLSPEYMKSASLVPRQEIYIGASNTERYVLRNFVRGAVNLEYLSGNSSYSSIGEYSSSILTSGSVHDPEIFLMPGRKETPFVENIDSSLRKNIQAIFKLTMGKELPEDILLNVLPEHELEREHRKHSRRWNKNIQGFALNRKLLKDFSQAFIKQNPLDILLITIGHEIGHLLSIPKEDILLEEAKAFAFELAWIDTIKKFDILGLKESMNPGILTPAKNGVHDTALNFVLNITREKSSINVFYEILGLDAFESV